MTFDEQRAFDLAYTQQIATELRLRFALARAIAILWRTT